MSDDMDSTQVDLYPDEVDSPAAIAALVAARNQSVISRHLDRDADSGSAEDAP